MRKWFLKKGLLVWLLPLCLGAGGEKKATSLWDLPPELLVQIFLYLDPRDLAALNCVCKAAQGPVLLTLGAYRELGINPFAPKKEDYSAIKHFSSGHEEGIACGPRLARQMVPATVAFLPKMENLSSLYCGFFDFDQGQSNDKLLECLKGLPRLRSLFQEIRNVETPNPLACWQPAAYAALTQLRVLAIYLNNDNFDVKSPIGFWSVEDLGRFSHLDELCLNAKDYPFVGRLSLAPKVICSSPEDEVEFQKLSSLSELTLCMTLLRPMQLEKFTKLKSLKGVSLDAYSDDRTHLLKDSTQLRALSLIALYAPLGQDNIGMPSTLEALYLDCAEIRNCTTSCIASIASLKHLKQLALRGTRFEKNNTVFTLEDFYRILGGDSIYGPKDEHCFPSLEYLSLMHSSNYYMSMDDTCNFILNRPSSGPFQCPLKQLQFSLNVEEGHYNGSLLKQTLDRMALDFPSLERVEISVYTHPFQSLECRVAFQGEWKRDILTRVFFKTSEEWLVFE